MLVAYYEFRENFPGYDWDPHGILTTWPVDLPETDKFSARDDIANRFNYELVYDLKIGVDAFAQAVERIDAMMDYYKTDDTGDKCITSLEMFYQPPSANSGTLSFLYDGYKKPLPHTVKLSWECTGTMTVEVKKGATPMDNGLTPIEIDIDDVFYVTYQGTGTIKFTISDDTPYLVNGSIKGDLYRNMNYNGTNDFKGGQRMLVGYAQFAKMKCELTIPNGDCVTFKNKYEEPTIDTEICGNKEVINGDSGKMFTFKLQQVGGSGLTEYAYGSQESGFSFTITKLKRGTYYYQITEIDPEDGCVYDASEFIVEVKVTFEDNKLKVTQIVNDNKPITFVNTYEEKPRLPETGGTGTFPGVLIGTAITLCAAAGLIYRKNLRKTSKNS
jgi:pilin isopeptide linkage protein/LPXTG-motif cell wall-anchored protein